jgi:5-deoxy-glucuronate isomerase
MLKANSDLLIRPVASEGSSTQSMLVTPERSGFEYLTFRVQSISKDESFTDETGNNELGLVVLGGRCTVESSAGSWTNFGGRAHVFNGLPYALSCRLKPRLPCEP